MTHEIRGIVMDNGNSIVYKLPVYTGLVLTCLMKSQKFSSFSFGTSNSADHHFSQLVYKYKMNLLQDLNKGNYEEFVTLNVDLLDSIPTVIDDKKASIEDKLMPPDSTKTGNFTKFKN